MAEIIPSLDLLRADSLLTITLSESYINVAVQQKDVACWSFLERAIDHWLQFLLMLSGTH